MCARGHERRWTRGARAGSGERLLYVRCFGVGVACSRRRCPIQNRAAVGVPHSSCACSSLLARSVSPGGRSPRRGRLVWAAAHRVSTDSETADNAEGTKGSGSPGGSAGMSGSPKFGDAKYLLHGADCVAASLHPKTTVIQRVTTRCGGRHGERSAPQQVASVTPTTGGSDGGSESSSVRIGRREGAIRRRRGHVAPHRCVGARYRQDDHCADPHRRP